MSLRLATHLLPHQEKSLLKAIQHEEKHGVNFLWLEPGFGKTYIVISLALARQYCRLRIDPRIKVPEEWSKIQKRREKIDEEIEFGQLKYENSDDDEEKDYIDPIEFLRRARTMTLEKQRVGDEAEQGEQGEQVEKVEQGNEKESESAVFSAQNENSISSRLLALRHNFTLNSRATLIVCPKPAVNTWANEARKHIRGSALIVAIEGNYPVSYDKLLYADFVVTTYETLLSAFYMVPGAEVDLQRKDTTSRENASPFDREVEFDVESQHALMPVLPLRLAQTRSDISLLFAVLWDRVVFDESHNVRSPESKKHRACVRLCFKSVVGVTGSPLRNYKMTELMSAFRLTHIRGLPSLTEWLQSQQPEKKILRRVSKTLRKKEEEKRKHAAMTKRMANTSALLLGGGSSSLSNQPATVATSSVSNSAVDDSSSGQIPMSMPMDTFIASISGPPKPVEKEAKKQKTTAQKDGGEEQEEDEAEEEEQEEDITLRPDATIGQSFASRFTKSILDEMAIVCTEKHFDIGIPECEYHVITCGFKSQQELDFYKMFFDPLTKTTIQGDEDIEFENEGDNSETSKTVVLRPSMMRLRQACIAAGMICTKNLRTSSPAAAAEQTSLIPPAAQQQQQRQDGATIVTEAAPPKTLVLSRELTPWAYEDSTKMKMFRAFVTEICVNRKQKTLVFSHYRGALDLDENVLNDLGVRYVRVDGDVSAENRHKLIRRFAKEPDLLVFLIIIDAMGESVNGLQTSCHNVLFQDPWFSPGVDYQGIRRLQRMGQKQKVQVYYLIIRGTYEEKVVGISKSRVNLLDSVLSGDLQGDRKNSRSNTKKLYERLLYNFDGTLLEPFLDPTVIHNVVATAAANSSGLRSNNSTSSTYNEFSSSSGFTSSSRKRPLDSLSPSSDSMFYLPPPPPPPPMMPLDRFEQSRQFQEMMLEQDVRAYMEKESHQSVLAWAQNNFGALESHEAVALLGENPILFAPPTYTINGTTLFTPVFNGEVAAKATNELQLAVEARQQMWRQHTVLRLHRVSWNVLFSVAVRDDNNASNLFGDLVMPLLSISQKPWSRAETTFAIFEKFCSLLPDYRNACNSGVIHGWLCDTHVAGDVPFVALYSPFMLLEEKNKTL